MKLSYTPGPWKVEKKDNGYRVYTSRYSPWEEQGFGPTLAGHYNTIAFIDSSIIHLYGTHSDNAKLISLAPQMFELLKKIKEKTQKDNQNNHLDGELLENIQNILSEIKKQYNFNYYNFKEE